MGGVVLGFDDFQENLLHGGHFLTETSRFDLRCHALDEFGVGEFVRLSQHKGVKSSGAGVVFHGESLCGGECFVGGGHLVEPGSELFFAFRDFSGEHDLRVVDEGNFVAHFFN